jgi:hypothetical protein
MSTITLQSRWHGPVFENIKTNKNDTNKLEKKRSQRREQEKCSKISAPLSSNKLCPTKKLKVNIQQQKMTRKLIKKHTIIKKRAKH